MFDQKLDQNHPHTTPTGRAISALNHPSSFRKVLISVHLRLKSFSFSYMFTGRIPPEYEWLITEPLAAQASLNRKKRLFFAHRRSSQRKAKGDIWGLLSTKPQTKHHMQQRCPLFPFPTADAFRPFES
jgi:hypothetical protein